MFVQVVWGRRPKKMMQHCKNQKNCETKQSNSEIKDKWDHYNQPFILTMGTGGKAAGLRGCLKDFSEVAVRKYWSTPKIWKTKLLQNKQPNGKIKAESKYYNQPFVLTMGTGGEAAGLRGCLKDLSEVAVRKYWSTWKIWKTKLCRTNNQMVRLRRNRNITTNHSYLRWVQEVKPQGWEEV